MTFPMVYLPLLSLLQSSYQGLIQSQGMLGHLVRGLKTDNQELQKHCASAIFKVHSTTDNLCDCAYAVYICM